MVRNLFQGQLEADACPFCGAPGGSCNDSVLAERLINPNPGATVLVESDIYETVDTPAGPVKKLRWRTGEFIESEEADRLGIREVPFVVRLASERKAIEEALDASSRREQNASGGGGQGGQA